MVMNYDEVSLTQVAVALLLVLLTATTAGLVAFKFYVQYQSKQYILRLTRPDARYKKLTADKPICPYMGNVLSSKGLRTRIVWPHEWSRLEAICREQLEQQSMESVRSAAFIVVPFLSYPRLMAVWKKLRLEAIPQGKMFGEFHPQRVQTGLHSDCVFPLQTPFPSFGIRAMVPQDASFFEKFEEDNSVRVLFNNYFVTRWPQHSGKALGSTPSRSSSSTALAETVKESIFQFPFRSLSGSSLDLVVRFFLSRS